MEIILYLCSMIKNENHPKVIFKEEDHTYWIEGKKGISMTSLISLFHDEYEEDYWLSHGAYKEILGEEKFKALKKELGYTRPPEVIMPPQEFLLLLHDMVNPAEFFTVKEQLRQQWEDSRTKGTAFHKEREDELYAAGTIVNPWDMETYQVHNIKKEFDNQSIVNNLAELEDGCYPELLVWAEFENFCVMGQVDVAYIGTAAGGRYTDTDDYKTNKSMGQKESFFKYHEPFSYLSDTKWTKYSLQGSGYQYVLELAGFLPRYIALTHYTNYDVTTGKRYDLPYMKEEIMLMIEIYNELMAPHV